LAELRLVSESKISTGNKHVIFIHGLQGNLIKTWQSSMDPDNCLFHWLAEDIEGIKAWTVGYPAAFTRWHGSAMHFTDRATNILERLLKEERLQTGEITLIGHSLGGLIIKQILRTAESMGHDRKDVNSFLKRIISIIFLATPHLGSGVATFTDHLRIFIRPSLATSSLVRNSGNLRDLNNWFREWAIRQRIGYLTLMESLPVKLFGITVVKPDSGDPGLPQRAISVDADHITICKPQNRNSEVYLIIKDFIKRTQQNFQFLNESDSFELKPTNNFQVIQESITSLGNGITSVLRESIDQDKKNTNLIIDQIKNILDEPAKISNKKIPVHLIDDQINKELSNIKRSRFFTESSFKEDTIRIAEKIMSGELSGGSDEIVSKSLAWCARILAYEKDSAKSKNYLAHAKQFGDGAEVTIAEAFISSAEGDCEKALGILSNCESKTAKSAALFIVSHARNDNAAIEWLEQSGINISELDSDGKFFLISKQLALGKWDLAYKSVNELLENDYKNTPALLHAAAVIYLMRAVYDNFRSAVLYQIPFEVKAFPLASDKVSLEFRRKAQDLFSRCAYEMKELGCIKAAHNAEDYALWLELRDPERSKSGLENLEVSMRQKEHSMRRLIFALRFGLKMDLNAVEQEINRQTTFSGGTSLYAAKARFTFALTKKTPGEVAAYIEMHREQMELYAKKEYLNSLEIEMLVRAGMLQPAEDKLKSLIDNGISIEEKHTLSQIVSEAVKFDQVEERKNIFENSGRLEDLAILISLLEEKEDWSGICFYGSKLFELTHSLEHAELLASALHKEHHHNSLINLFRKYPEFIAQSDIIKKLMSWSLYFEGELEEATAILKMLLEKQEEKNNRILEVYLAIASGNWESLQLFIEKEWNNRENRDSEELMKTAILAQNFGSPRVKDLVTTAVIKDNNNAHTLSSAYILASHGGWETDSITSQWLQKAAELSEKNNGPFKKMSFKDLFDQKPDWDKHESEMLKHLTDGDFPLFGVAKFLNRSLIDMYLLPALANLNEPDLRRRVLIPAYSGSRPQFLGNCSTLALDATSLLTLGYLDLFDVIDEAYKHIIIPHSTLLWLFEENQSVSFHQPSRIENAKKLRSFLSTGLLKEFKPSISTNSDLAIEVGEELSSFITEANADYIGGEKKRFVIRAAPVHRLGSLMEEEADLSVYENIICSSMSVVDKLKEKGQITSFEEQRARAFLKLSERQWPNEPLIPDGATLYLDNSSISHLQSAGILGKLQPAGLEVYISSQEVESINALLTYDQLTTEIKSIIEKIRKFLATGIQNKKIMLGPLGSAEKDIDPSILHHPSWEIVSLARLADALIVDDRFLNRQLFVESGTKQIPIMTTIDLIEILCSDEKITLAQLFEYRTRLRQAGFAFIPVRTDELLNYLSASERADNSFSESAELKAIRENILQIRMSQFLQLPGEATWLHNLMQSLYNTLHEQWKCGIKEPVARVRSKWLFDLMDYRPWSHCQKDADSISIAVHGHKMHIMSLIFKSLDLPSEIRNRYWEWIEEQILDELKQEDPDVYSWLIQEVKKSFSHVIKDNELEEAE
jgi:hypothetical protein